MKVYHGFVVSLLVIFCSSVQAQISILGPTGGVKIPYADALGPLDFAVAFHTFKEKKPDGSKKKQTVMAASVGLQKGFEVGLSRWEQNDRQDQFLIHTKWQIRKELKKAPAVAIGGIFFTNNSGNSDHSALSLYAVASEKLTFPKPFAKTFSLEGHVGLGSEFYHGAFYGVDLTLFKDLNIALEYDSHQLNSRANFFIAPGIAIQASQFKDNIGVGLQVIVKK